MDESHTIYLSDQWRQSIDNGDKTIELRVPTDRNARLILKIQQYRTGDLIRFVFTSSKHELDARITRETERKALIRISSEELYRIAGIQSFTHEILISELQKFYPKVNVNEGTQAYLVHFELTKHRS